MTAFTETELDRIGDADELRIASRRSDGSLRGYVIIWVVRVGDELYVRSAYGPTNPWYRRAIASGSGRIQAGGVERDTTFDQLAEDDPVHEAIHAAFHEKYDSHGLQYVEPVAEKGGTASTLRLVAA